MIGAFTITNALIAVVAVAIAIHFKFFVRKILIALGYPKLQVFHPDLGVYEVGSVEVRLSNDLPASQIFYPVGLHGAVAAAPASKTKKDFVPYFRPEAVKGFVDFLYTFSNIEGVDWILQMLHEIPHPLSSTYGEDPLQGPPGSKKFPLVLFSHGLGGNMEMYTEICSQIASLGTVVVAPEHADTSGSYAVKILPGESGSSSSTEEVYFRAPDKETPYSRKKMQDLRGPGLQIRVDELTALYDHILAGDWISEPGDSESCVALARSVLATSDPLKLHLVGHSFGGSTQLLAAQRWAEERALLTKTTETTPPPILPLSVTICDAWNFALTDAHLAKGIPSRNEQRETGLPILSVLSEDWATTFEERWALLEFLRSSRDAPNTCKVESYYAKHSVHNSFSDAESWFPTPIARMAGTRGKTEDRHATINAVVAAFAKTSGLVDSSDGDQPLLVPFSIDEEREGSSE